MPRNNDAELFAELRSSHTIDHHVVPRSRPPRLSGAHNPLSENWYTDRRSVLYLSWRGRGFMRDVCHTFRTRPTTG